GRRLRKKKNSPEPTNRAAFQPAIQSFQQAIRLLQEEIPLLQRDLFPLLRRDLFPLVRRGCLLLLRADSWALELPPARLSQSFARTLLGVRHRPECRCIFS